MSSLTNELGFTNLLESYNNGAVPYNLAEAIISLALDSGKSDLISKTIINLGWVKLFKPFITLKNHTFYQFKILSDGAIGLGRIYIINMGPLEHARILSIAHSSGAHIDLCFFDSNNMYENTPKNQLRRYGMDREVEENKKDLEPVKTFIDRNQHLTHCYVEF